MLSGNIPRRARACARGVAARRGRRRRRDADREPRARSATTRRTRARITPGLIERAVELERQAARPSNNYSPREILGLRLMYADRLDEARELLEASLETADRAGRRARPHVAARPHDAARVPRRDGSREADEHAREAALVEAQSAAGRPPPARFVVALADAHVGRVEEARAAAEQGAAAAERSASQVFRVLNLWALGFLELSLGDHGAAERHAARPARPARAMGYVEPRRAARPRRRDRGAHRRRRPRRRAADRPARDARRRRSTTRRAQATPAAAAGCCSPHAAISTARSPQLEAALGHHDALPAAARARAHAARARHGSAPRQARGEARETLGEALELFDALGAGAVGREGRGRAGAHPRPRPRRRAS